MMARRPTIGVLGLMVVICLCATPAVAKSKAVGLRGNPGLFFGPDAYPVEAIRLREQGRVVAKLWIDRFGRVASCTIYTSSGSSALDKQTCDIALEKVTFEPAQDQRGRTIAASYMLPVRWVLPTGPVDVAVAPPPPRWSMDMTISIEPGGKVAACNATVMPIAPISAGPCDEFPVGSESGFHWVRDGKPVGGVIKRHSAQEIALDP